MKINALRLYNTKLAILIEITSFANESQILDTVAIAITNGANIIEVKNADTSIKHFTNIVKKIQTLASEYNAIFIIHDRLDIATIIDADGVFLTSESFEINEARKFLGENKIIGTEVQTTEQLQQAIKQQIDYISCNNSDIIKTEENTDIPLFVKTELKTINMNIPNRKRISVYNIPNNPRELKNALQNIWRN